jgi:hypothetical protein
VAEEAVFNRDEYQRVASAQHAMSWRRRRGVVLLLAYLQRRLPANNENHEFISSSGDT